mmetsp:Transcript_25202/g.49150  ORF Transcript_25202/g.49150 Transcript_25202/m.49150 type:complete len:164 (-) Transcript_25202:565-1056(-)
MNTGVSPRFTTFLADASFFFIPPVTSCEDLFDRKAEGRHIVPVEGSTSIFERRIAPGSSGGLSNMPGTSVMKIALPIGHRRRRPHVRSEHTHCPQDVLFAAVPHLDAELHRSSLWLERGLWTQPASLMRLNVKPVPHSISEQRHGKVKLQAVLPDEHQNLQSV